MVQYKTEVPEFKQCGGNISTIDSSFALRYNLELLLLSIFLQHMLLYTSSTPDVSEILDF